MLLLLAAAWAPQAARGHAGGGFSSPFRRNHTADCTVAPLVNGTARTAFSCSAPGCLAKANNAAHNRRCRAHWWDKAACLAEAGDICDIQSEALRNPPYSKAADVDSNPCRPANGALPDNKWLANAGGNLTLTVLAMRNLPDADGFGALGGLTDAYVRASIGAATRESSHVAESLNPDWRSSKRAMDGRDMRFGPRLSGRRLHVQVYDRDGGLELGDDYLGDIETSVAFCSRFTAQDAYVHHCPGLDEGYCTPPERGGNCFWDQQAQRCTYAADADAPFNSAVAMKGAQQQPRLHVCAEEAWLLLRPPAGQRAGWDPTWSCAQAAVSGALPAPGTPYDKSKPTCVLLKQTLVPFDMQVAKQYAMTSPSKLVGVGIANAGIAAADSPFGNAVPAALAAALGAALEPRWQHMGCDWADGAHFGDFNFGRPWDDVSKRLGTASGRTVANGLYGALVVRTPVDHKEEWGCNPSNLLSGSLDTTCASYCLDYLLCNLANCSAIARHPECEQSHYVEIAVNAPAQLTIFRLYEDNFAADGVTRLPMHNPAWMADWTDPDLLKPPKSKRASIDGDAATTLYKGWVKDFATTSLDVNGVVQDNSGIKLGFNRPRPPSKVPSTMYFVLATMTEHDDSVAVPCSKAFDRAAFFRSFAQFGVTFFAFLLLWWRFMQRIEFRLDRVESFLVEQKMVPLQQRNIVAAAFAMYNDCPQNRDFRRNLYYATRVVWVLAATPFVILWTWGASMMATVQPVTVGFGAITVGTAALLTTYATMHWRYSGYRIDRSQLALYVASFLLLFAFLGGIVFLDACARSFFSITALFMALNMLPMIWLAFTNDVVLRKSLKQLVSVVSSKKKRNFLKKKVNILGSLGLKLGLASGLAGGGSKGGGGHARSQDDIPESPFHDLTGDCYTVVGSMPTFKYADVMTSAFAARPALRRKRNKQLYALALALLAGYGIVCAQSGLGEKASALAWAVVVTCVVTDSVIYLLRRGNLTWTPGYTCLLMGASRTALVAFGSSDYWLLGMSIVLFIFGIAICAQIVNKRLPRISPMDAGQVVFFGRKLDVKAVHDMTATPEFALGYLSFLFVFLLLAAAFVQPANMPLPIISVMGQNWPVWVFAAIAFLSMLTFGLADGTTRAFYLMEKHLLTPRQASLYLWSPAMRLPFVLAIAAEVMVVCSGLFVYGATGSSFVVTTAVFAPIIAALTMMVYVQWTKNDYALVRWPPVVELVSDDDDDDEDGDDILGKGPGGGTSDLFALPPMRKGAAGGAAPMITMPSLPLKSTLRKKAEDDEAAKEAAAAAKEVRALAAAAGVDLEGEAEEAKKQGDWRQQRPAWRQKHWFADFLLRFSWSLVPDALAPHLLRGGAAAARVLCAPCRKIGQARKSRARIHATPGDDAPKPSSSSSFGDALALGGGEGEGGGDDTAVGVAAVGGVSADEAGFAGMSVLRAFCEGYLLDEDYYTLGAVGGLLAAVNLYGVLVALVETPYWAGHALWVGVYVVLLTVGPLIKYFHSYRVTADMKGALGLGLGLLVGAAVAMFQVEMKGDANDPRAFQVLALVCLYPTFLAWGALWYRWYDDGWELSRMVALGFPLVYASLTVWVALLYFWAPLFVFSSALLLLLLTLLVKWFLKAWVDHEFYLSPWYAACGANIMKFTALGAVVLGVVFGADLFYCLSLAFFFVILHKLLLVAARQVTRPKGAPLFFSPYIFPVYSYEPCTDKLVEENAQVQNLYLAMFYALCWGVVSAMFVEPVGIGAAVCAAVLVLMATVTCVLGSVTPVKMGQAARCVDAPMLREAGQQAQDVFAHRRLELDIVCPEFAEKAAQEAAYEAELELLTSGGGAAGGPDAGAGGDAMLSRMEDAFAGAGSGTKKATTLSHAMEVRKSAATLAWEIEDDQWKVKFEEDAEGKEVRRFDGLMTWRDAFADAVRGGHGPLGFLALGGLPYRLLHLAHRCWCKQAEANSLYDADGARKQVDMRPLTDTRKHLLDLIRHDRELAAEYAEEMRCIVHFQMLVLVCSEAKLHRESTLFQKFLRENRFKLMSNGINPPRDIFRTHSFASIDISLVAVWLLSLTPEERERFHELKAHFTEEMGVRDMLVDEEDAARREEAAATRARFKRREDIMCRRRFQDFQARRERRVELGIEPAELIAGGKKKKVDEAMVNAEEALLEIDSGWSCRPGSHGRALQFNDPDFSPDGESIGNAAAARKVVGWRQANAIATGAGLFADGTDPDDVHQGHVQDGWLMSAISIVAASGGVDDGKVDALIDSMFITKTTSLTGAYALRFWVNGQWETVIVDDFFPVLDNKHREEDCNGAFSSYSKGFAELWVPLIEKALAKYYGSYAALEVGHVQQALSRLTGGEAEEIYLAHESRGAKKAMLWDRMLAWRRNQFLLGAGTVTADTADHEAQDTGLVFGATYVVYEVRVVDGYQLVKLRNPPGDHPEWKGDWGDNSRLWTRRLKAKLGYSKDAADNTFWMSFDDFCNAFRSLYVCRYYEPHRWPLRTLHGAWQEELAAGVPSAFNPDCLLDHNPQYTLSIARPTELCITLSQVDAEGLAPPEVHPIVLFVVAHKAKDRAMRVTHLDTSNVVASSGDAARTREVKCYCTLQPRVYTILCATYVKGMEGPFALSLQSNFPIKVEQLWPAPWKDDDEPKVSGWFGLISFRSENRGAAPRNALPPPMELTWLGGLASARLILEVDVLLTPLPPPPTKHTHAPPLMRS